MNDRRFSAIAEFIGVAAVVLSLVFVGMEIRQSADINSAQAVYSLNQTTSELLQQIAINADLAELLSHASNDFASLDENEQMRARFWYRGVINNHEAAWKFHSKGLIDDQDHQAWLTSFCDILIQREGARIEWQASSEIYNRRFVDEYNTHCGLNSK